MGVIDKKMNDFMQKKGGEAIDKLHKELERLNKNMEVLQDHTITIQKNQVEFEKYLRDIKEQTNGTKNNT